MNLHLVGGFLGSGKTTAIIGAARLLITQGKRVGVITNDQGKYLVDTAFFKYSDVPVVEVTGGCFCCNYEVLETRLNDLVEMVHPDIIFAESVGSCADIVATVLKPLLQLRNTPLGFTSLSVFSDARLFRTRLLHQDLPFSEDVVYIFDKQIEEAGIIVINKVDLLSESRRQEVKSLAQKHYPDKQILMQNSLDESNLNQWVWQLERESIGSPLKSLEIDYDRYGAGESHLAWLDKQIVLEVSPGEGRRMVINLVQAIITMIRDQRINIGHIKFFIRGNGEEVKISFSTFIEDNWEEKIPLFLNTHNIEVLINGRVETEASIFFELIQAVILEKSISNGVKITDLESASFHPKHPRPTYRIQ